MSLVSSLVPDKSAWKAAVRTAAAGGFAFILAQVLTLPQSYWAVLTAIVVMQSSVGASIKAATDRFLGTFAGAAIGFIFAILTPSTHLGTFIGLILATAITAMLAARNTSYRIAPMTAAIMLIAVPSHVEALISAVHRTVEIGIGCVIGVLVAMLVFPSQSEGRLREHVSHLLGMLADLIGLELGGAGRKVDEKAFVQASDNLTLAFDQLDPLTDEVNSEHMRWVGHSGLDANQIRRRLNSLLTAVLFLRRLTIPPRSTHVHEVLDAPVEAVSQATQDYLRALGASIENNKPPPSSDALDQAFAQLEAAAAAVETQSPGSDAAIRVTTFTFALQQVQASIQGLVETMNDPQKT